MPLVNTPVRWSDGSRASRSHAHAGVVVVNHFALRRLPNQLIPCRFDQRRSLLHNLPLRRRRQRNAELIFQLFQPVERSSTAVLEQRDHRCGRLVVLLRAHAFRLLRGEHLPAGAAAQPIQ
jgi:hypothetical protein